MSEATPDAPPPRGAFGLRAALAVLGGILLMALMGMTVTDVIGRYLFNAPLRGATELTELLLAAVVFLGLPAVALADEHVTVDLVTDRLPRAAQPWRLAAAGLFSAVVLAVVAWRVWVYASQIGGYGGTTTTLAIPIAPLGYFCAVCTGVGALLTAAVPAIALARHLKGH
ncbi:TRAP-type C4-dicarboxylate transport system, small permease component [Salipiger thiooxidans]|uniref:TRAP transporter small permease protein n=1 Tax=Salipiger thiooxidans TaxID=282683 RepID=A0A1G7BCM7_9RHOB|nr:TRAP transporter small permease [Salipiger thiooxidans]SDE24570.1 TRAP-type C4-dicarboxylate transport system, small permease component [Salipiger thiooxidans]